MRGMVVTQKPVPKTRRRPRAAEAAHGGRLLYRHKIWHEAVIWDGTSAGQHHHRPAIVESDATTFVPKGFATLDKHRLFHLKEVR